MPGAILGQETCRAVPPDLPRFTTCRLIDHGSARFPTQCRAGASNHRKTLVISLRLSGASPYQLSSPQYLVVTPQQSPKDCIFRLVREPIVV